ncbi:hypothetical protein [Thalassobaculum litoreum]|uniref:hypothetical protein n=1 Tax=Thalassobaculum litoreum TaxID=420996 RepID=UPI000B849D0E|nr:hypothetical protein [Thalassobaculum litoreum]
MDALQADTKIDLGVWDQGHVLRDAQQRIAPTDPQEHKVFEALCGMTCWEHEGPIVLHCDDATGAALMAGLRPSKSDETDAQGGTT